MWGRRCFRLDAADSWLLLFCFCFIFFGLALHRQQTPLRWSCRMQVGSHWRCATHLKMRTHRASDSVLFLGGWLNHQVLQPLLSCTSFPNSSIFGWFYPCWFYPFWGVLKWEGVPQIIQFISFFCIETTIWVNYNDLTVLPHWNHS